MTNISKSSRYAIQALHYIARKKNGSPIRLRQIAADLGMPFHFLGKVFQALAREGIVTSRRGVRGGFELVRAPGEITLAEIVRAVEGEEPVEGCVLGFALCSEADPCRLHHDWERSMSSVRRILSELTIDDIGKGEVIPLKHAANSPL